MIDANPHQPTHDQMYLAERLDLTIPSVVALNRKYGREYVQAAMRLLHGFPPEVPVDNPYGWVSTVAALKAEGL